MDNIPLMFYLSHIIKKRNVISLSYCHSLVSVSVLITVLDIIISHEVGYSDVIQFK